MVIGYAFYSPQTLGKRWMAYLGTTQAQLGKPGPMGMATGIVASLVNAWVLALLAMNLGGTTIGDGVMLGILCWLGFMASLTAAQISFEKKPWVFGRNALERANVESRVTDRIPALYLGHGAPPLVDDPVWPGELAGWAKDLPKPKAILVVSAHWEESPLTIGATTPVPLVYDFYGFPQRYYQVTYPQPGAPWLAERVKQLIGKGTPTAEEPLRGLDHGAYVPLTMMYPEADIPVLQISMPSLDAKELLELGTKLAPLRDEGVLIMGSGFMTHGLPFLRDFRPDAPAPSWSKEFDHWAAENLAKGDIDSLLDYKRRAPGMPYAHPTVDHFVPLFVTVGASLDTLDSGKTVIDGYFLGLSKRSLQYE